MKLPPRSISRFSCRFAVAGAIALFAATGHAQELLEPDAGVDAIAGADGAEPLESIAAPQGGVSIASSRAGSITVGAFAQAGYEYLPDAFPGEKNAFALHHAALEIRGRLEAANLALVVAGDAAAGLIPGARRFGPGGEMRSDDDVPFITDAAAVWEIPLIGATLTVGRFVPSWGVEMPTRPTRLGAIGYPLYVHGNAHSLGRFRNVGLEVEADLTKWLAALGGVFNGGVNSFGDPDDYKDVLVGISLRPVSGLEIRGASFFAFRKSDLTLIELEPGQKAPEGSERHIQPIVEARYRDRGVDLLVGGALDAIHRADGDPRDDVLAFGVTGHAGVLIVGDWFELFARVDYFDPDAHTDADNQLRITAGPQFLLGGRRGQIRAVYAFDRFGGDRAMCETYLEDIGCSPPLPGTDTAKPPPEAKRHGSTIIVQIGVDL